MFIDRRRRGCGYVVNPEGFPREVGHVCDVVHRPAYPQPCVHDAFMVIVFSELLCIVLAAGDGPARVYVSFWVREPDARKY